MDSSSTPSKSSPEFRELDDLLKCGVCHETMTTPVLTPCSHSYCSLCIRKWLDTKQVCPTCSVEVYENSLRKNPIVENIIEAVHRLKTKVSGKTSDVNQTEKQLHVPSPSSSRKPQVAEVDCNQIETDRDDENHSSHIKPDNPRGKSLHGNGKVFSTPKSRFSVKIMNSEDEDEDADDFQPTSSSRKIQATTMMKGNFQNALGSSQTTPKTQKSPAPARVQCPVCSIPYPERFINDHLDKCLVGEAPASTRASNNSPNALKSITISKPAAPVPSPSTSRFNHTSIKSSSSTPSTSQQLKHIKKMVYNLMSDSQVKKELKKYGLSAQGDRRTLVTRHQRWVIMHNAECDASHPRCIDELRKQFEKDERALTAPPSTSLSQIFKSKHPESVEFDTERKDYIKKNKDSFDTLIHQIKIRKQKASLPVQQIEGEEDSSKDSSHESLLQKQSAVVNSSNNSNDRKSNGHDEKVVNKAVDMETVEVITDDEEDFVSKVVKQPVNCVVSDDSEEEKLLPVTKNLKRKGKFIEDSESDEETSKPVNKKAAVKRTGSPVLTTGTNVVRRQLRSRSQQTVDQSRQTQPQKKTSSVPETKKAQKKPPKKTAVKEAKKPSMTDDSCESFVNFKKSSMKKASKGKESEDTQLVVDDDEDMFVSPASSEIPCGQKLKSNLEESGDEDSSDDLSQLVSLMDEQNNSGSSTDFE